MIKNWERKLSTILVGLMLMSVLQATNPAVQAEAANNVKLVDSVDIGKSLKISKIADINKTVTVKSQLSMPSSVTATMSDNTTKAVAVKWDKKLSTSVKGTFKADGTVKGYSKKVVYTLIVNEIPKMGTIDIPKVTDSTLKKPTDIKLGIGKASFYKGSDWITVDKTMPSVFWSQNATEADFYIVRMYDQYKQKKVDTYHGICQNDMSKQGYYDIRLEETVDIRTITITPINSIDGRAGGDNSNDKVGETAVFECSVDITQKSGKALKVKATPLSHNPDELVFTFPEKTASYAEYYLRSEYTITDKNRKQNKRIGQGSNAEKDGSIMIYVDAVEYKEKYNNPTAKVSLSTYSNAKVTDDTKASFVINVSPLTCQ